MNLLINWILNNWTEILAAMVSITYVVLAIRQLTWFWVFGILSAGLYAWVYGHSGFYAGMALQGYYAIISIYGWIHWAKGGKIAGSETKLPLSLLKASLFFRLVAVWILLWIGIGYVLGTFTDSTIPFWDAFTTAGGIVATWMLARKILEQWLFWIVIDAVSVGLYLWQGLHVTSVLFIVYIVMAVIGYQKWKKTGTATE